MSEELKVEEIIETLARLQEDTTIPKNVKIKIQGMINILEERNTELSIKINKVLHELDDIGYDANMQPYVRMQLLNVVSMLEKI